MDNRRCRVSEDLVSHVRKVRRTKRLSVHVGVVEFSIYLARFDLTEGNLLLDIVENHDEVLAFLCVAGVTVGHCDDRAVIFHDDDKVHVVLGTV